MVKPATLQQKAKTLAEITVAYGYLNKALVTTSDYGMKKQAATIRKILYSMEKEIFGKFYQDYSLHLEEAEDITEEIRVNANESKPVLTLSDEAPLWAHPSWEDKEENE